LLRYTLPAGVIVGGILAVFASSLNLPHLKQAATSIIPLEQDPNTASAKAAVQIADLNAEIARKSHELAELTTRHDQLQSQVNALSNQVVQANAQLTSLHSQSAHADPPGSVHAVLQRRKPPQENLSARAQLIAVREAILQDDPKQARDRLEAIETLLVFGQIVPSQTASPDIRSTAATQITDALSMLEAGDEERALRDLNQAIAALGSSEVRIGPSRDRRYPVRASLGDR
jgi:chromosome segregation ATPase